MIRVYTVFMHHNVALPFGLGAWESMAYLDYIRVEREGIWGALLYWLYGRNVT